MFKKHPKGISVLFFTEMWERYGFYTLMAIFVLYMEKEFGWDDSKKGNYYGIFLAMVYFLPLLGGWLGDRILGAVTTIRIGLACMTLGYIALAVSSQGFILPFYFGLALIAFGTGIFKVNMSVAVGNLYNDKEHLKDSGYNIYYMGVNVGATIAPLSATAISIFFSSYRISFTISAIGLVIAFITFELGKKYLIFPDHKLSSASKSLTGNSNNPDEDKENKARYVTLAILFLIMIFFWIGFYQNGFAMTLFAERSTQLIGFLRPETYQFFNPCFIIFFTPALISFFSYLRSKSKEPANPTKIFWGMLVSGIPMLIMFQASLMGGDLDQNIMSPAWLISAYFFVTISELLISPMGLSFVSKVAPKKTQGLMMGFWFSATAAGSYGSGMLGKYYSSFSHHEYFLLLAIMLFISALLVFVFRKKLNRFTK
jgi:proton-dependent oligopeptide transporter, POT family